MSPTFCTCGEPEPHVIAHRLTYDGIGVNLWSDGAITGVLGLKLRGVPIRRPKTQEAADRLRKAGWLALGEVCIRKVDELPGLLEAADKAARIDNMPGTLRRLMREVQAQPAPVPPPTRSSAPPSIACPRRSTTCASPRCWRSP